MGRSVCQAITDADGLELVARIGRGDDLSAAEPAAVLVDFATPDEVVDRVHWALSHRKHVIVGCTGLTADQMQRIRELLVVQPRYAVLVIPNFSKAAMLAQRFAVQAATHFEFVEIMDLTHERKTDAPSGTSNDTANAVARARKQSGLAHAQDRTTPDGAAARGVSVGDVRVHSIRMKGFVSHQAVILGKDHESLTIRFDTLNRAAFTPEILRAIQQADRFPGLHCGLESLYSAGGAW
jgi:4-hydroxy-tetrahydrodipicolinate reductase